MGIQDYKKELLNTLSLDQIAELYSFYDKLKKENKETRVSEEIRYVGKDGREYYSYNDLIVADEKFMQSQFPYIGEDGHKYATFEELTEANIKYWNSVKIIKIINDNKHSKPFNINEINNIKAARTSYLDTKTEVDWMREILAKMSSPRAAQEQENAATVDYQSYLTDSQRIHDMLRKIDSPSALEDVKRKY